MGQRARSRGSGGVGTHSADAHFGVRNTRLPAVHDPADDTPDDPADDPADDAVDHVGTNDSHRGPAKPGLPQLRRRNIRIAFVSGAVVAAAVTLYLVLTPDEPNRPQVLAVQALGIAISVAVVAVPQQRSRRWLSTIRLLHLWALSQTSAVGIGMWLDGGLTSPITVVLLVPLLLGAVAFRAPMVVVQLLLSLGFVLAAGAATGTLDATTALVLPATLVSCALVAGIAGRSLWQLTSDLAAANAELSELARSDSLTGCRNHRSFHTELAAAVARANRADAPLTLVLLDLDDFKAVNDVHGHAVGDRILLALAESLRWNTRAGDVIGRTGGEEFSVLLPDTAATEALTVAERIRLAAGQLDPDISTTASLGLAVREPGDGEVSAAELIRESDRAMYAAKAAGRDRAVAVHLAGREVPAASAATAG